MKIMQAGSRDQLLQQQPATRATRDGRRELRHHAQHAAGQAASKQARSWPSKRRSRCATCHGRDTMDALSPLHRSARIKASGVETYAEALLGSDPSSGATRSRRQKTAAWQELRRKAEAIIKTGQLQARSQWDAERRIVYVDGRCPAASSARRRASGGTGDVYYVQKLDLNTTGSRVMGHRCDCMEGRRYPEVPCKHSVAVMLQTAADALSAQQQHRRRRSPTGEGIAGSGGRRSPAASSLDTPTRPSPSGSGSSGSSRGSISRGDASERGRRAAAATTAEAEHEPTITQTVWGLLQPTGDLCESFSELCCPPYHPRWPGCVELRGMVFRIGRDNRGTEKGLHARLCAGSHSTRKDAFSSISRNHCQLEVVERAHLGCPEWGRSTLAQVSETAVPRSADTHAPLS